MAFLRTAVLLSVLVIIIEARPSARGQRSRQDSKYDQLFEIPEFDQFLDDLKERYHQMQRDKTTTTERVNTFDSNPFLGFGSVQTTTNTPQDSFSAFVNRNQNIYVQAPDVDIQKIQNNPFLGHRGTTTTTQGPFVSHPRIHNPFINPTIAPLITPKVEPTQVRTSGTTTKVSEESEQAFQEQARNAKYSFASQVDDSISENLQEREETRDGLKVKGKYSYSDGFYKRTVEYEADEKGYRVVGESVEAIGNGPQNDPNGRAVVQTFVGGNAVKYEITGEDLKKVLPRHNGFVGVED